MQLTHEEERMLAGDMGAPVRDALELQRKVGRILGRAAFRARHQRAHDG